MTVTGLKEEVRGVHFCGATGVRWWLPNTNHVPDHQSGVQAVQTERHSGCWDAISSVQHMNRQRAQVCCSHDLAGQLWTAVDKRTITAEADVLNHEMTEFCFL